MESRVKSITNRRANTSSSVLTCEGAVRVTVPQTVLIDTGQRLQSAEGGSIRMMESGSLLHDRLDCRKSFFSEGKNSCFGGIIELARVWPRGISKKWGRLSQINLP